MDCIINKSSLRLNERDRLLCYIFSKSPVTLWKKWINSIYDKDMYLHLIKEGSK